MDVKRINHPIFLLLSFCYLFATVSYSFAIPSFLGFTSGNIRCTYDIKYYGKVA